MAQPHQPHTPAAPLPARPPLPLRPRDHLIALGGYVLLSLLATWPLARDFSTRVMGEQLYDRAQPLWNLWWVGQALLTRQTDPFHTDLLFYPQGVDLYFYTFNFPSTLVTLGPLALWGPVAAYNFSILLAFVLAAYAGFRLVAWQSGSALAGLFGGIIAGFSPLALHVSAGQINILSIGPFVLCLECYLRAWHGGRGWAVAAGFFGAVAMLVVGYYEIYLLIFGVLHGLSLGWAVRRGRAQAGPLLRRGAGIAAWGGGTAALLLAPYLWGALGALRSGRVAPDANSGLAVDNSADILGFLVPDHNHWLIQAPAAAWGGNDHTYLGYTVLALAAVGVGARRGRAALWLALAGVGAVLALGPVLQVAGQRLFPLPFGLLQAGPPFNLVSAPERFATLTYVGLAVLAGWGIVALGARLPTSGARRVAGGVLLALLLLEMPLHPRFTSPLPSAPSLRALAADPTPGAVLELPLTGHGWRDGPRMVNQIVHGRPITGGYLSRPIVDPNLQLCSPVRAFSGDRPSPATDIITPTLASQGSAPLVAAGFRYILLYKWWPDAEAADRVPLPEAQRALLQGLAAGVGTVVADDDVATAYQVRPAPGPATPYLQLGTAWHPPETSAGQPFRWMDGATADVCVMTPAAQTATLDFAATSFARARRLQVWVDDRLALEVEVPADGVLHPYRTPPLTLGAGPHAVRLVAPDGSARPVDLGLGRDARLLSLGFSAMRLAAPGP